MIIRETFRHRSLQNVCSFPSKTKEEHRVYLGESLVRYIREDDIDEEELETEWSDNE